MNFRFEQALDACLAQLNTGADLEAVLSGFPEHADALRPALAASEYVQRLAPPPERRLASKGAFVAAVAERRRLVEQVEGLVVEVKVGVPVGEILARTAAPLQAVVCAAHAMQVDVDAVPMPSPDAIARGKALLVAHAAQRRAASGRRVAAERRTARPSAGGWSWPSLVRRAASSAVALAIAASIGLTGALQVTRVAASSLPGDTLYQVKIIGQSARMLFTFDPAARTALQAEIAQRRLADIERLVASGRSVPADAIERLLAEKASIDGLSAVQRAMLGGWVRTMARDDAALAERLRGAAVDPSIVDDLLREDETATVPQRKPAVVPLPAEDLAPAVEPAAPAAAEAAPAPQPAAPSTAEPAGPGLTAGTTGAADPSQGGGPSESGGDTGSTTGSTAGDEPEAGPSGSGAAPAPDEPEPPAPPQMQPNADPEPEEPAAAPVMP